MTTRNVVGLAALRLVIIAALATLPEIAHADMRIAIGNDVFIDAIPPMDDTGFTNDIDIHFWRPYRAYLVGGRLVHRWITEDTNEPMGRRRDLVDLLATVERPWRFVATSARIAGEPFAVITVTIRQTGTSF